MVYDVPVRQVWWPEWLGGCMWSMWTDGGLEESNEELLLVCFLFCFVFPLVMTYCMATFAPHIVVISTFCWILFLVWNVCLIRCESHGVLSFFLFCKITFLNCICTWMWIFSLVIYLLPHTEICPCCFNFFSSPSHCTMSQPSVLALVLWQGGANQLWYLLITVKALRLKPVLPCDVLLQV